MNLRYIKRPWKPEDERQLREMAEAGKTITMIALRLKRTATAVRGRFGITVGALSIPHLQSSGSHHFLFALSLNLRDLANTIFNR